MSTEASPPAALPDDPWLLKRILAEQEAELGAARQQIERQQAELAALRQRIETAAAGGNSLDELSLCRAIIAQQQEQLAASQRKIVALEERLHYLLRRLYMPRSERLADPNQKVLFELGGQEAGAVAGVSAASPAADPPAAAASAAPPKRQGHGRRRAAAVLFTLLSSAKRHGLNTWAYLRDVLWRLADLGPGELAELLPDRWKDSRAG